MCPGIRVGVGGYMNLFEFFVKMTHMHIPDCWEETTATFTGRTRRATIRARRRIVEADYDAYEIAYYGPSVFEIISSDDPINL